MINGFNGNGFIKARIVSLLHNQSDQWANSVLPAQKFVKLILCMVIFGGYRLQLYVLVASNACMLPLANFDTFPFAHSFSLFFLYLIFILFYWLSFLLLFYCIFVTLLSLTNP